jgi:hypothetical protein
MSGKDIEKEIVPDQVDLSNITVVSGHCPVGEERWYCLHCNKFVDSFVHSQGHMNSAIKVFDQGGVDTEVEIKAAQLGVKTEIYPAEVKQWEDEKIPVHKRALETLKNYRYVKDKNRGYFIIKHGFRSRNIQIAEASNVVYCLVPKVLSEADIGRITLNNDLDTFYAYKNRKNIACEHCKVIEHPQNGGCWTLQYAKKLGKETHLVVIE